MGISNRLYRKQTLISETDRILHVGSIFANTTPQESRYANAVG